MLVILCCVLEPPTALGADSQRLEGLHLTAHACRVTGCVPSHVPAGNEGDDLSFQYTGTVEAPATCKNVLAVGASQAWVSDSHTVRLLKGFVCTCVSDRACGTLDAAGVYLLGQNLALVLFVVCLCHLYLLAAPCDDNMHDMLAGTPAHNLATCTC
jgi:hypothetical protein